MNNKTVNVDFVARAIEIDLNGKEHFIAAALAAEQAIKAKEESAASVALIKSRKVLWYDNIAAMKADVSIKVGSYACTAGYYKANDGGGGSYIIRAKTVEDVEDGGSIHFLQKDLVAELIVENGTVNVKQFGAKGDGVSDDTAAIQASLNKGFVVSVIDGNYKITQTLNLNDNQVITGNGSIYCKCAGDCFFADAKNDITINGVSFYGEINGLTYSVHNSVFKFLKCHDVKIYNCRFNNLPYGYIILCENSNKCHVCNNYINKYPYSAIMGLNGTSNFNVSHNTVLNGYGVGYGASKLRYPICLSGYTTTSVIKSHDLIAAFNYIEDETALWEGIDSHGGDNIKIIHNTIKGTLTGIAIVHKTAGDAFTASNVLIDGNYLIGNDKFTTDTIKSANTGISLSGYKDNWEAADDCSNYIIKNNIIKNYGKNNGNHNLGAGSGIKITHLNNVTIANNIIDGACGSGICLYSHLKNVNVSKNTIDNITINDETPYNYGINGNDGWENVIIADNNIGLNSSIPMLCAVQGAAAFTKGGYAYCRRNNIGNATNRYTRNNILSIDEYPSDPSKITYGGKLGQIAYKFPMTATGEIGWVCVKEGDALDEIKSTWKPIGNLV